MTLFLWVKLSDLHCFGDEKGSWMEEAFPVANLSTFSFSCWLRPKTGGDVQVGFGTWLGQVYPRICQQFGRNPLS